MAFRSILEQIKDLSNNPDFLTSNIDENGQQAFQGLRPSVVCHDRYRLVHRWVPEMVLNVQSESPSLCLHKVFKALGNFLSWAVLQVLES